MKIPKDLLPWVIVFLITIAITAALSVANMLLWNWIMPDIILCSKINFWQSAGMILVISLLTFDKFKLYGWLYE